MITICESHWASSLLLVSLLSVCARGDGAPIETAGTRFEVATDVRSNIAAGASTGATTGFHAVSCARLRPRVDPFPSPLVDDSGLFATRFGRIRFDARDGNRLTALTYRGSSFDPRAGPIWFVMHGAGRTAKNYLAAAAPVAERHGALAIAVRFPKETYPTSNSYTLGVKRGGKLNTGLYDPSSWREADDYLYSEVEHLFEAIRAALKGAQTGYLLFGHSAGAQFTHRLLTFLPDARVLGAVAANAGWYTMPGRGGGKDPNFFVPYGLQGSPLDETDLCRLVTAPLTVLLGERDTATPDQDELLRGTPQAMAQGATRLARGRNYFAAGAARARALGEPFRWRLGIVPRAGHKAREVMPSAGFFLFEPGNIPCKPSTAAMAGGLVITEILADPPRGAAGDANGDGVRDSNADEFVEFVNAGSRPLCLTGWTLTDAGSPARHLFPLGRALPPGGALVVFGGGQPTGSFAQAEVQWAAWAGRLNLSNAGDVLTLRDATGAVVRQVSWGDCDGAPCAEDHLGGNLNIEGAIVRWPGPTGKWVRHRDISAAPWSPGTRVDGRPW